MSATMDVDNFSKYFNNAPVFYIEGRQHKVEVFHAPVFYIKGRQHKVEVVSSFL